MRALLVTANFPPLGGGVSRYYEGLVGAADGLIGVAGLDYGPPMPAGNSIAARLAQVIWAKRIATACPQEVHILAGQPHLAIGSLLARRQFGLFIHGGEWGDYPAGGRFLRKLLSRAKVIVTSSRATALHWVPLGLSNRVIVIRPGLPAFVDNAAGSGSPPAEEPPSEGHMRVLAVARLSPRKGMKRLINAIDLCVDQGCNVSLDLVGDGPERDSLARAIRNPECIKMHPATPDEELARLYSEADLFALLPQQISGGEAWEGFGIVFLEAAAYGLPVLTTRTGGVQEATTTTGSIALDQDCSGQDIAAVIKSLYEDPSTLREMGFANRLWVETQSWAQRKPRIEELLDAMEKPGNRGT